MQTKPRLDCMAPQNTIMVELEHNCRRPTKDSILQCVHRRVTCCARMASMRQTATSMCKLEHAGFSRLTKLRHMRSGLSGNFSESNTLSSSCQDGHTRKCPISQVTQMVSRHTMLQRSWALTSCELDRNPRRYPRLSCRGEHPRATDMLLSRPLQNDTQCR